MTMDKILALDLDPTCKECDSRNTKFLHNYDAFGNSYRVCKSCKATRLIQGNAKGVDYAV